MKIKTVLVLLLISALITPEIVFPSQEVSQNNTVFAGTLSMAKLRTDAIGLLPCTLNVYQLNGTITKAIGTQFGGIRITLNVTVVNSNNTYTIALASFSLTVTQRNVIVANSTDASQFQAPTNTIASLTLFPNIPVVLVLSFKPVCVIPGSIARLNYLDGTYNFVFDLP